MNQRKILFAACLSISLIFPSYGSTIRTPTEDEKAEAVLYCQYYPQTSDEEKIKNMQILDFSDDQDEANYDLAEALNSFSNSTLLLIPPTSTTKLELNNNVIINGSQLIYLCALTNTAQDRPQITIPADPEGPANDLDAIELTAASSLILENLYIDSNSWNSACGTIAVKQASHLTLTNTGITRRSIGFYIFNSPIIYMSKHGIHGNKPEDTPYFTMEGDQSYLACHKCHLILAWDSNIEINDGVLVNSCRALNIKKSNLTLANTVILFCGNYYFSKLQLRNSSRNMLQNLQNYRCDEPPPHPVGSAGCFVLEMENHNNLTITDTRWLYFPGNIPYRLEFPDGSVYSIDDSQDIFSGSATGLTIQGGNNTIFLRKVANLSEPLTAIWWKHTPLTSSSFTNKGLFSEFHPLFVDSPPRPIDPATTSPATIPPTSFTSASVSSSVTPSPIPGNDDLVLIIGTSLSAVATTVVTIGSVVAVAILIYNRCKQETPVEKVEYPL